MRERGGKEKINTRADGIHNWMKTSLSIFWCILHVLVLLSHFFSAVVPSVFFSLNYWQIKPNPQEQITWPRCYFKAITGQLTNGASKASHQRKLMLTSNIHTFCTSLFISINRRRFNKDCEGQQMGMRHGSPDRRITIAKLNGICLQHIVSYHLQKSPSLSPNLKEHRLKSTHLEAKNIIASSL